MIAIHPRFLADDAAGLLCPGATARRGPRPVPASLPADAPPELAFVQAVRFALRNMFYFDGPGFTRLASAFGVGENSLLNFAKGRNGCPAPLTIARLYFCLRSSRNAWMVEDETALALAEAWDPGHVDQVKAVLFPGAAPAPAPVQAPEEVGERPGRRRRRRRERVATAPLDLPEDPAFTQFFDAYREMLEAIPPDPLGKRINGFTGPRGAARTEWELLHPSPALVEEMLAALALEAEGRIELANTPGATLACACQAATWIREKLWTGVKRDGSPMPRPSGRRRGLPDYVNEQALDELFESCRLRPPTEAEKLYSPWLRGFYENEGAAPAAAVAEA